MAPTFYYLPLRARGESTRMILKYGKVEFKDVVVSFPEWGKHKAAGDISLFGQLPSLVLDDGKIICQTGALIRYAAKLANVFPSDPILAADADMMVELAYEMNMINPILCFFEVDSEKFVEAKTAYFASLPTYLTAAEKLLAGKAFFGGETPSYGDFAFVTICINILAVEPAAFDTFPAIKSWTSRVSDLPGMKEYLAERPGASTPGWGKAGTLVMSTK